MTQVRQATNEIQSELQKSADTKDSVGSIGGEIKDQVDKVKEDFDNLTDSIKRKL